MRETRLSMRMSGYTKLFSSILASTVWREPNHVRIVWITLLAMAGKNGVAEGSVPGLADFARVSLEDCLDALAKLKGKDDYSRTKDNEGRRIADVDGGWQILNHAKYRAKLNSDERREYLRVKQQEQRDKRQQSSTNVNSRSESSTLSTHAEAEATTEEVSTLSGKPDEKEASKAERQDRYHKDARSVLHLLNDTCNRSYRETDSNLALISARLKESGVDFDGVALMIARQCQRWMGTEQAEYLRPETLFGKSKFDSYYAARKEPVVLSNDPKTAAKQQQKMDFVKAMIQ